MFSSRTKQFRRNESLEKFLSKLSEALLPAEKILISKNYVNNHLTHPIIFIVGPLRSGTTLFMQWLANTGLVCYPTNLLSRFYSAPIIGAMIQLMLTDPCLNFRNELIEFTETIPFASENGKTAGSLSPNEFWYFWRRFLSDPKRDVWSDDELRQSMDTKTMLAELAGVVDVFNKPFACKGLLFNYNIPFIQSIFDNIIFVQIKRDLVDNTASVIEARKRQLGSEKLWYSFKIPEQKLLENLNPISQAAGQVFFINAAIEQGLAKVSTDNKIMVQYENFCADPATTFKKIVGRLGFQGIKYTGEANFNASRVVDKNYALVIKRALENFLI